MEKIRQYSLAAVIPNYNGRALLEKNLPFLLAALENSGCQYEVIISDDHSSDDSVLFIRQNYPQVTLVESPVNSGFSVNINRGIVKAEADLVLLLNSDIRLSPDYFLRQLPYFEQANTFGVMGRVLNDVDQSTAESCKYPLPSIFKINHFKDVVPETGSAFTWYLSGANALVDRQKLVRLGGFNALYSPFYQEDLDLSLRAWELGWTCFYEHNALCYHEVSSTIRAHHQQRRIRVINSRNKLFLQYFHLHGLHLTCWIALQILSLLVRWALGQRHYYEAVFLFLKRFGKIRAYKQQFKKLRKEENSYLSLAEIKKTIRDSINRKS